MAIRNNHYLQALHLTNYNTKLSVNYNASLIANYNLTKKHLQNYLKAGSFGDVLKREQIGLI